MTSALRLRCKVRAPAILAFAALLTACGGGSRRADPSPTRVTETGIASWYGPGFHGKPTASGETYDQNDLTAAHRTLPLGTRVRVTNLANDRRVTVRINDRGPFVGDRIIDLSRAAARELDMIGPGTARVRVEVLESPRPIDGVPAAPTYTVQLGSFAERSNAERLRDRARERFEGVELVTTRSEGRTLYRVLVGSFTDRAAADREFQRLVRAGFPALVVER
jgi:rare lipoprotein A